MRVITMNNVGSHGDVTIQPIIGDIDLSTYKKLDTNAVAFGEVTGHLHALATTHVGTQEKKGAQLADAPFAIYENAEGEMIITVDAPTTLSHQEHLSFLIEPGTYGIGIAKQLNRFSDTIENVLD